MKKRERGTEKEKVREKDTNTEIENENFHRESWRKSDGETEARQKRR